jgi:hypothetical protein
VTNCQSPIKLVASSLLRDLEIKRTFILKVGFKSDGTNHRETSASFARDNTAGARLGHPE